MPRITEQTKPHAYWVGFHAWLNSDGLSIIAWWAEEFLRTVKPVARGEHAPRTSAKQEVIDKSMSEGYRIAFASSTGSATPTKTTPRRTGPSTLGSWS